MRVWGEGGGGRGRGEVWGEGWEHGVRVWVMRGEGVGDVMRGEGMGDEG